MKKPNKIKVIVNPVAGQGRQASWLARHLLGFRHGNTSGLTTEEIMRIISATFSEYGVKPDFALTDGAGDAKKIAKKCARHNYDAILAVGGDGTINEVINGIAGTDLVLGVVPLGTANIFAIQMNLPGEIEEACKVLFEGKVITIDLGRVNKHYFACMAGIGFDAYVIKVADYRMKRFFGAISYVFAALLSYFSYRFTEIKIKIDGQKIKRHGHLVLVFNGKYYGGQMVMAPKADLDDGYLDVCIFKCKNIFSFISYAYGIFKGNLHKYTTVEYYHCKKFSIKGTARHSLHADAEYIGETPAKIRICPKFLKVTVPGEYKEDV